MKLVAAIILFEIVFYFFLKKKVCVEKKNHVVPLQCLFYLLEARHCVLSMTCMGLNFVTALIPLGSGESLIFSWFLLVLLICFFFFLRMLCRLWVFFFHLSEIGGGNNFLYNCCIFV